VNSRQLSVPVRRPAVRWRRWVRVAAVLAGLAALTVYLRPGLATPHAHWPLWDVRVYWWGGQQAARGGPLYAPGARYSFTYPPFAAALFTLAARGPEGDLAAVIAVASIGALAVLCALSLGMAGVRRRPETVFAVTALALLTCPVAYTLHLGEVNLILAALAGTDLLRRHDGQWWQGIATGLAAGIKLTPLIFVGYLLITRRVRAGATAAATFAATVAVGIVLLPSQSRVFWLDGVFHDRYRIGDPANPSDQSLSGAVARLAGSLDPAYRWWWAIAALLVGLAGIVIAAWAHRCGHRLAGVTCCAVTGLLISPFSWTHHWVWAVPLLVALAATAWRRRSAGYGLVAAAVAAVFSGRIPLPGPGYPAGPVRLLEGDLYVLCGLAALAGTALALMRERAQVARTLPSNGREGSGRLPAAGCRRPGELVARRWRVPLRSVSRRLPDRRRLPGEVPVPGPGRAVLRPGPVVMTGVRGGPGAGSSARARMCQATSAREMALAAFPRPARSGRRRPGPRPRSPEQTPAQPLARTRSVPERARCPHGG
jgi:alpha-1,2-mannosyltransferase